MSLKVLFVDDDPDIRRIASMSLSAVGGYAVTVASSGSEALEVANRDLPDVVLLDVMMPGMDGLTTLGQLRANVRTASVPVIFMTAKVQKAEVDQYRAAGAGFIAKPFDPMRLPADVARLLDTDLRRTA
jgi:two-component system OmpR family response regulator